MKDDAPRLPLANTVTRLDHLYSGDCITQPHNASWRSLEFTCRSLVITIQVHIFDMGVDASH